MRTALSPRDAWAKYDTMEARLTAGVSERMLDLAGIRPGMRVLDLASGRGEPALRAATRVGEAGRVIALDISEDMVGLARNEATRLGLSNVSLCVADAEMLDRITGEEGPFDAALCRWGLMYMARPLVVLTAACASLRSDASFVAAVWVEPGRVPWATLTRRVLGRFCDLPPFVEEAPGAFRYADPSRIERDWSAAGFTIEKMEEISVPVLECRSAEAVVDWCLDLGFARLAERLPPAQQVAFLEALLREAETFEEAAQFQLGGVTRLVLARRS